MTSTLHASEQRAPQKQAARKTPISVASISHRAKLPATRLRRQDLACFTTQLAIMTRAGVDVVSAIRSIQAQSASPRLKKVLADVSGDIVGGAALSTALSKHESSFGATYVASIAAGEVSGQLSTVVTQLAKAIQDQMRLQRSLRAMLVYPLTLMAVSTFVILGLVIFVLPKFAEVFAQFGAELPQLTAIVLRLGESVTANLSIWCFGTVCAALGSACFLRSAAGKRFWDRRLLYGIGFRKVTRPLYVGRACRLLGLMLRSGVTLLEAIRLTRAGMNSHAYVRLFDEIEEHVLNGRKMAPALSKYDFIPASAIEMLTTGERTGTLAEVTWLLADHYEEAAESQMRELIAMLEPIVTVGMGLVVATIVLSVMVPMFDLSTLAERGLPGN